MIFAFALMTFAQSSFAATAKAEGKVGNVYVYGDGRVLVTGFTFPGASCNNNGGFWMRGNHPHLDRILSNILTAKATGTKVNVIAKINDCWYPELLNSSSTYLYY